MTASPKMPELLPCPNQKANPTFNGKCHVCNICDGSGYFLDRRRTPPPAPSTPASVGEKLSAEEIGLEKLPSTLDALIALVEAIETDGGIETSDWPEFETAKAVILARHIQGKEGVQPVPTPTPGGMTGEQA